MEENPMLRADPPSEEAVALAKELQKLVKQTAIYRMYRMKDDGMVEQEHEECVLIFSVIPEGRVVTINFGNLNQPDQENGFGMGFLAQKMTVEMYITEENQEEISIEDKHPDIPPGHFYRFKQTFTLEN